jgi:hypothetical protein
MSMTIAADDAGRSSIRTWVFNPFHYIAGGPALIIGILAILSAGLIGAASKSHFDGVLDYHSGASVPLWLYLCEGMIDWLAMAVILLLAAKVVLRSRGRALDIVGTQALARAPTLLSSLAALLPGSRRYLAALAERLGNQATTAQTNAMDAVQFVIAIIVILAMTVWMVALMYRAFSVSANAKGGKAIITFVVAILVAETLSKLALVPLYARVIV